MESSVLVSTGDTDTLSYGFNVEKGIWRQPYAMGSMKLLWDDDTEET